MYQDDVTRCLNTQRPESGRRCASGLRTGRFHPVGGAEETVDRVGKLASMQGRVCHWRRSSELRTSASFVARVAHTRECTCVSRAQLGYVVDDGLRSAVACRLPLRTVDKCMQQITVPKLKAASVGGWRVPRGEFRCADRKTNER
jgi:hypothetical protein